MEPTKRFQLIFLDEIRASDNTMGLKYRKFQSLILIK